VVAADEEVLPVSSGACGADLSVPVRGGVVGAGGLSRLFVVIAFQSLMSAASDSCLTFPLPPPCSHVSGAHGTAHCRWSGYCSVSASSGLRRCFRIVASVFAMWAVVVWACAYVCASVTSS
jgi:hypothetical protein